MFKRVPDLHFHQQRITVDSGPTHVHEHRAPTDESVKLLMEMEEQARDKIVHTAVLHDMPLACTIFVLRHPDGTTELEAIYDINGKRHRTQARRPMFNDKDRVAVVKELHESIARQVAEMVVLDGLTAVDWQKLGTHT